MNVSLNVNVLSELWKFVPYERLKYHQLQREFWVLSWEVFLLSNFVCLSNLSVLEERKALAFDL